MCLFDRFDYILFCTQYLSVDVIQGRSFFPPVHIDEKFNCKHFNTAFVCFYIRKVSSHFSFVVIGWNQCLVFGNVRR